MKTKCTFFLLFIIFICISSCKKSTTEPPDCRAFIKIKYTDKFSGQNLTLENTDYLNALKISKYVFFGDVIFDNGINSDYNILDKIEYTEFSFYSSDVFDICKPKTYERKTTEKIMISYGADIPSDSIIFIYEKFNNNFQTTYYLNDSLIGFLQSSKNFDTEFYPPVINIKK